jgi:hypothetical protein
MAAFENITLDQAWELPILQAFNDLSYLKAEAKYENDLRNEKRRR